MNRSQTKLFLVSCLLWACVTAETKEQATAGRALVLSTLDLFVQSDPPKGGRSWLGDWEFRRDRLDLIDAGLRDLRPDIAIFQNAMERSGSVSENDSRILRAGSMSRYEWQNALIEVMTESGEDRNLSVATLRPGKVKLTSIDDKKFYWSLGADGHIAVFEVQGFGEPIVILNTLIPSRRDQAGLWYSFVEDRVSEILKSKAGCKERIVIAGYLPTEQDSRRASGFMTNLGLKDTATGFCQNASRCQTATMINGIYAATRPDEVAGQLDRILVHESAQVLSANLAFNSSREFSRYKELYNLSMLWPSQRFGWTANVRFSNCKPTDQ